jgi:predicted TIM-barrel fold metal-dependent hydrolase
VRLVLTVDIHTFVAPALECVYNQSSESLRSHWPQIEQHVALTRPTPGVGDWPTSYLRIGSTDMFHPEERGPSPAPFPGVGATSGDLEPGILHDNPSGRVRAMDRLGTSVQVISPALALDVDGPLGSEVTRTVLDAYNRYLLLYCAVAPDRLKAVVQLHGHEPHWSAQQLEETADDDAAVALTLHLPPKIVPDSPYFAPIWQAVERAGLPLLHRPSAGTSWWTPQRLLSYLALTGILDRYPGLRLIFAGWPPGWVADWCESHSTSLLRYLTEGRVHVGIDARETPEDVQRTIDAAGEHCLLWQSHFPFGDAYDADEQLAFLDAGTRDRVARANAAACLGLDGRARLPESVPSRDA